ncbi:MAG: hypothetical protein QGG40_20135, partial [Myxococcota bacterium]|nr:hypothetical protein [Myxococcota bacterium]
MIGRHVSLLFLLTPGLAWAGDAAVTPMVNRGVDPVVAGNITSMVTSELDFTGEYGFVDEISPSPAAMNSNCLVSSSCLGNIANDAGVVALVAGKVSMVSKKIEITLVLYDHEGGNIV